MEGDGKRHQRSLRRRGYAPKGFPQPEVDDSGIQPLQNLPAEGDYKHRNAGPVLENVSQSQGKKPFSIDDLVEDDGPKETTKLSPAEEAQFQEWVKKNNIKDVDAPGSYYDYRGAFKDGLKSAINPTDNLPHWPDTYKQHGHPTFSEESKYSTGPGDGGTWDGEKFIPAGSKQKPKKKFSIDDVADEELQEKGIGRAVDVFTTAVGSAVRNTTDAIFALSNPSQFNPYRNIIVNKIRNRYENAVEAAPIFGKDLLGFFDAFSKKQLEKTMHDAFGETKIDPNASTAEVVGQTFKDFGGLVAKGAKPFAKLSTYTGIAPAVVEMFTRPMELLVGEDFSHDARPLTPEETAKRSKQLLGDAVMVLVTHNVAGAISDRMVGNKAIKEVGTALGKDAALVRDAAKSAAAEATGADAAKTFEVAFSKPNQTALSSATLAKAGEGGRTGALARRVVSNSVGGAVGGFAGGLVANSGEDEALTHALIQGVMGVPLGFAQEYASGIVQRLRGKFLDTPEQISVIANSILAERQTKLYADDSIESATLKLQALKTSDDLSEAAKKLGGVTEPYVNSIKRQEDRIKDIQDNLAIEQSLLDDNDPDNPNTFEDNLTTKEERAENIRRGKEELIRATEHLQLLKSQLRDPQPLRDIVAQSEKDVAQLFKEISDKDSPLTQKEKVDKFREAQNALNEMKDKLAELEKTRAAEQNRENIAGRGFDLETFKQNFYHEFSESAYGKSGIMDTQAGEGTSTINATPGEGFNFDRHLLDFAKSKGIPEEAIPALRADIIKRLKEEVYNAMEPDERFALDRLTADLEKGEESHYGKARLEGNRVARIAHEQGMYVEKDGMGNLILKNRETGEAILNAKDSEELIAQFAADAGRPRADNNLVNGSAVGVPIEAIGNVPPTPPRQTSHISAPWSPKAPNFSENLVDIFNISKHGSKITAMKDVIASLDNKNKTFLSTLYDETQVAYRRTVHKLLPLHKELNEISAMGRNLNFKQWEQISQYRQARTPKELVDRFTKTRGVSKLEQEQGQWLHDNDIDLAKVFAYDRAVKGLVEMRPRPADYDQRLLDIQVKLGVDAKHLEAYTRKQAVQQGSRNVSDYGAVTAYFHALQSGISRADYAHLNKMTPQQITIAERLDKFYDARAVDFGIDSRRQLEDYMNHYQRYKNFPEIDENHMNKSEVFLSQLPRTGEFTDYESHPIVAAMRYTTAGVKVKEFYPAWNKAWKDMEQNLDMIQSPAKRAQAERHVTNYLNRLAGNREMVTSATVEWLAEAFKRKGVPRTPAQMNETLRIWMSDYFGYIESAAQGLRPSQGIRDFYGLSNNYYIRFGAKRTARAMALFTQASKETWRERGGLPSIDDLEREGQVASLQPYQVVIAGEHSSEFKGTLARGSERAMQFSFESSLQKLSYRNGHAMIYLEAWKHAGEVLDKLEAGGFKGTPEEAKAAAYREIGLQTYDPGIQVQFDRLAQQDTKAAAKYLGRLTAAETVFAFGAANQPGLMTSLPGALLGQFGVWSAWESRFVTRMMSRGTVKDRLTAGTRWAMSQAAVRAADGITGINLSSWFLTPTALIPRGGPSVQAAASLVDMTSTNQRQADMASDDLNRKMVGLGYPGATFLKGLYGPITDILKGKGPTSGSAYDLWMRGFDPLTVAARVGGVSVDEVNNNWWDAVLRGGEIEIFVPYPFENYKLNIEEGLGFQKGRETIPNQIMGIETQKKEVKRETKASNQQ